MKFGSLRRVKLSASGAVLGALAFAWAGVLTARAEIVWKHTVVELPAPVDGSRVTARFPFEIKGDRPIRILSAVPSCGCLKISFHQDLWKPGEKGEIEVLFDAQGLVGLQEKNVVLLTDDAPARPHTLGIVMDIPEPVSIRPRLLAWKRNEPPVEQAVSVTVASNASFELAEVRSLSPRFEARLEKGEGRDYRVVIRPKDTAVAASGTVELRGKIGRDPKLFLIHAAVR